MYTCTYEALCLQVNGTGVEGLTQPDVVQLLRQSEGSVMVVISRQEVMEKREEEEVREGGEGGEGGR